MTKRWRTSKLRSKRLRVTRLTAVSLLALVLLSCGGGDNRKPAATTVPASPFLSLLDWVPDTLDARRLVVLNDYVEMRRLIQQAAPRDPAAVAEYRKQLLTLGNAAMPSHLRDRKSVG